MTKYKLMVCPHDTARKPERWFLFAQQLGKKLESIISFEPSIDFKEFHDKLTTSDIIYVNPQDSLRLYRDQQYIPLAYPGDLYDEVVFIANKNVAHNSLQDINEQSTVSVRSMMPTCLAIEHLRGLGIKPALVTNRDSWMAVIKAVYRGGVPYGFVYRDFYESLNPLTRDAVNVIDITNDRKIYHMFMLNPQYSKYAEQITEVLLNFHAEVKGGEILKQLNMSQLQKVAPQAIDELGDLSHVLADYKNECEEDHSL